MSTGRHKSVKRRSVKITPEMWEKFFRHFQTPLFLEDVTEVMRALAEVRNQGITDFADWLDAHPEFTTRIIGMINIIEVNDFAVEWSGARNKRELMVGVDRMILPESLPAVKQVLVDLFEGRAAHAIESQYITFDGRHRYTWNQALLPQEGDDPPLLVFAQSDITDLKLIQRDLRSSQDRYSRVVEAAQDVILCHDLAGRITFINQAGLDLTGWTREQLLARDVIFLLPDHRPESTRRKSLAHLGESGGRTLYEAAMATRDGREIPVEVNSTIIPGMLGTEGEHLVLAMIRDISDRQAAEKKQRELENHLKSTQKMESLGVLAGGIAHDFNNLLVTIMGNTELLLSGNYSSQEINESLGVVLEASTQAADLCRQMQAYAGQTVATVTNEDLNSILDNMSRLLQVTVAGRAHIGFQLGADLPEVKVDAGQLRQVIMNLVTNAVDSLGEDGGEIMVRTGYRAFSATDLRRGQHVSLLHPGDYIYCEVRDSGRGMNTETVQCLFDPFFTTKEGSRGLGLSSALGIIQSHRGGFLVDSQIGKGTAITFLLPFRQKSGAKASKRPPRKKEPDNLHLNLTGKTVLSVDEDAAVRSVGDGFLRRLGCKVLSAGSGPDAVRIFGDRHQDIHAVLLDLTMAGMDGVETCRRLRVIRPDLPVVFSSGFTAEEVHQKAADLGDYAFVPKPFRLAQIREVMAEVLGPRKAE